MSSLSFIEALDQALQLLEQGQPLEQCLQQFPEYADELRPLLMVSDDLRRLANTSPTPTKPSTQLNWEQLLHDVPQQPRWVGPWLILFRRARRTARGGMMHSPFMMVGRYAVVALLSIGLTWGTYDISEESTKNEPILYAFKRTSENIQLAAASLDPQRYTELRVAFNVRRWQEAEKIYRNDGYVPSDVVQQALTDLEGIVADAKDSGNPAQNAQVAAQLQEAIKPLETMLASTPPDEQKVVVEAQQAVVAMQSELQGETPDRLAEANPAPSPTPAATREPATATPTQSGGDVPVRGEAPVGTTVVPPQAIEPTNTSTVPPVASPTATPTPTNAPETPTSTPIVAVPPPDPAPTAVPTTAPEPTATLEPTPEPTDTPTATPEPIAVTPTPEPSPSSTPVPSETVEPSPTPSDTPVPSPTIAPTETPTAQPSPTIAPTDTVVPPTNTPVPPPAPSDTPEPSPSLPPTATVTTTVTVTPTTPPVPSPVPTEMSTPVPSPSATVEPWLPPVLPTIWPTPLPTPLPQPSPFPSVPPLELTPIGTPVLPIPTPSPAPPVVPQDEQPAHRSPFAQPWLLPPEQTDLFNTNDPQAVLKKQKP